jgi:hypothetical protein
MRGERQSAPRFSGTRFFRSLATCRQDLVEAHDPPAVDEARRCCAAPPGCDLHLVGALGRQGAQGVRSCVRGGLRDLPRPILPQLQQALALGRILRRSEGLAALFYLGLFKATMRAFSRCSRFCDVTTISSIWVDGVAHTN